MSTQLIIIAILGALVVILFALVIQLRVRFKRVFMGTKAKDLEEVMNVLGRHIEHLEKAQDYTHTHLEQIDARLQRTVRNVETIRFNPFADTSGGNQSFAIALLNDDGDGVILSSLYARERMSIFAKPVVNGISTHELTDEESDVLKKAYIK